MDTTNFGNVSSAAERFFRFYHAHCVAPDLDTLFSLLESAHSLNDRLKIAAGIDFLDIQDFKALKCLRNYFHHQEELRHSVRVVPIGNYPIVTDLAFLCLVPREIVVAAIEGTMPRHQESVRQSCQNSFHWYGPVVNINPCIFNFVVSAYERLQTTSVPLSGDAVEEFEAIYQFEDESGLSHFVDGKLSTSAGSIDELLVSVMGAEI